MHIIWRIQGLKSSYALIVILYADCMITVFCIARTLYEHLKTNNTTGKVDVLMPIFLMTKLR